MITEKESARGRDDRECVHSLREAIAGRICRHRHMKVWIVALITLVTCACRAGENAGPQIKEIDRVLMCEAWGERKVKCLVAFEDKDDGEVVSERVETYKKVRVVWQNKQWWSEE